MSSTNLLYALAGLIPLVLSLTVHEFAHAWSASRLGDDTASRMGRLTLNPLPHIDPIGTLLLPFILTFTGAGFLFGWAKPVPVDPSRFRRGVHMGRGMAWTAAAGPLSNLVLALVSAVIFAVLYRFDPGQLDGGVGRLLETLMSVNVTLALFNLIPVPPLDGSRIVDGYMPFRYRPAWEKVVSLAPFLLLAIFFYGGRIIAGPVNFVEGLLTSLMRLIVSA